MRSHQFVMYLFNYKIIDVRWCWDTGTKGTTFDEALKEHEAMDDGS